MNQKQLKNYLRCRKETLKRRKQIFKGPVELFEINICIVEIEKILYFMDHGIKPEIAEDAREKAMIGGFVKKDDQSIAEIKKINNKK